ncbi:MAG: NAD(P)/FAD-dependent oxidoreductase, partial [Rhodospirillales bacterium]|nr:NAD(P)/FAD-dependent oxidoreductase [Rhodospirillales bacterium]
ARFDSESYSYQYSFSKELLDEWNWSEHFSGQPETLRSLNYVADKFDLRKDIQFRSRVKTAQFQEAANAWEVTLEDGSTSRARFLITAVGPLSAPTKPRIDGIDSFKGEAYHTGMWPHHPVSFEGKRTPNWCKPLRNGKITDEKQKKIKASHDEIFKRCEESTACFLHTTDPRGTFEVSAEEREAFLEKQYASAGFGMWQGNFKDMLTNREANKIISDFVANKIRQRVKDPAVADKLIPKNHGFGTRRVPMETNYYEVYNQPNVKLVDIKETPIERITPTGLETSDGKFEFDMIIFATGFDAITGSLDRIDIRGKGGLKLKDKWRQNGIETFVGVQVRDFPNMMMLVGPHTALGNIPRSIEYAVDWVTRLVKFMQEHDLTVAEAKPEAVDQW